MLFKQGEVNCFDEASALIESSQYLTEEESEYSPSMIPIVENARLGCNILKVEDLVDYAFSNGIMECAQAITDICKANCVDESTLAFSVSDVNMMSDSEMADTVQHLKEAGATVYATPISSNDIYCQLTEAVVDIMIETCLTEQEDYADELFESFIIGDIDKVINEASIIDKIKSTAQSIKDKASSISYEDTKKSLAKKISSAIKKLAEIKDKIAKATSKEAKKALYITKDKVEQSIIWMKNKLKSLSK